MHTGFVPIFKNCPPHRRFPHSTVHEHISGNQGSVEGKNKMMITFTYGGVFSYYVPPPMHTSDIPQISF